MRRKITYPAIVFLLLFSLMTDTASASTKKTRSGKKEAQSPYTLNMTTSDLLLGDSFILTVHGTSEECVTFKSSSSDVVSVEP